MVFSGKKRADTFRWIYSTFKNINEKKIKFVVGKIKKNAFFIRSIFLLSYDVMFVKYIFLVLIDICIFTLCVSPVTVSLDEVIGRGCVIAKLFFFIVET